MGVSGVILHSRILHPRQIPLNFCLAYGPRPEVSESLPQSRGEGHGCSGWERVLENRVGDEGGA